MIICIDTHYLSSQLSPFFSRVRCFPALRWQASFCVLRHLELEEQKELESAATNPSNCSAFLTQLLISLQRALFGLNLQFLPKESWGWNQIGFVFNHSLVFQVGRSLTKLSPSHFSRDCLTQSYQRFYQEESSTSFFLQKNHTCLQFGFLMSLGPRWPCAIMDLFYLVYIFYNLMGVKEEEGSLIHVLYLSS